MCIPSPSHGFAVGPSLSPNGRGVLVAQERLDCWDRGWRSDAAEPPGAAAVVELLGAVGAHRGEAERGEGAAQQPGRGGAEQGALEARVAAGEALADSGSDDLANHDF